MNSKLYILIPLFLFIACSTPHIKKETIKPIAFSIDLDDKNLCIQKLKYFKILAAQATDQRYFEKINSTSLTTLCTSKYHSTQLFMEQHFDKIGIILEKSQNDDKSAAIIDGIKASLSKITHKSKGSFIIRRVDLQKKKVNKVIGELVLKHKVGLLITWGQKRFIEHIQRWQNGLGIPGLFISNNIKKKSNSFNIFPHRVNYAKQMIRALKQKNINKIAILTPTHIRKTPLLRTIKYLLKKNEIEIVRDIPYQRDQFETYDQACRYLFNIDDISRVEELELIKAQEELKANAQGFILNEKHVFLPAQVDFQAILIPDDFRTVHQFTKLFDYYQAKDIQLFGTYQWRSKDLLKPNEKLLEGATFIDFLGDYKQLPIQAGPMTENAEISATYHTDYKLMGYYTGLLSQRALKSSHRSKKKVLSSLKNAHINDNFIKSKAAFTNNEFNWPSFTIEVKDNHFRVTDNQE